MGLASHGDSEVGDRQSFLSGRTPSHAKVLISDSLSPRAVEIFRERGVEVDVKTGLKPEELKAIIGEYDGLAIRSATKVTKDILSAASRLKVVGRAGIGVDMWTSRPRPRAAWS